MRVYAVIDTNVIVSALLARNPQSATVKVCANEQESSSLELFQRRRGALASVATKNALAFPRSCNLLLISQSSKAQPLTATDACLLPDMTSCF